jgi:hypothetical protein
MSTEKKKKNKQKPGWDTELFVLFPLFGLGTAASLGIVSADILPYIDLGDVFVSTGGIDWTLGRLLAVVSLVGVIVNRDNEFNMDTWGLVESWMIYATLGLIIAPPFFPALEQTFAGGLASYVAFTVQSIGFGLISWVN